MWNFKLSRINRLKFKNKAVVFHTIFIFCLIAAANSTYSDESESDEEQETCIIVEPSSGGKKAANFTDVLSLINEGKEHLNIDGHDRRAILILGNTGVGKTTLSLTINGNLSKLHLAKTPKNTRIVFDENNLIGGPSVTSKTFYPNYIVNPTNNVSFYDCPGFNDNRGAEEDIAAMYFIKAVTEHLTEAKFLLVAKHPDVTLGDRNQFLSMTKHAARLLKNTEKFNHSMGLVVTKVDSRDSDSRVVESVSELLTSTLEFLSIHLLLGRVSEQRRHEITKQIIIVETLLEHSTNSKGRSVYPKIAILRSPTKCGPFDEKEEILKARGKIIKMYSNNLQYAKVTPSDFGFTLKDSTSERVRAEMIPNLRKKIEEHAENISELLEKQYLSMVPESFDSAESAATCFSTLETTLQHLNTSERPSEYLHKIATGLSLSKEQNETSSLQTEENLLSFFVNISHHTENVLNDATKDLVENFRLLDKLKEKVRRDFIPRTGDKIRDVSEKMSKLLLDQSLFTLHARFPEIQDTDNLLKTIHSFRKTINDLTTFSTPSDLIQSTASILEKTHSSNDWGNLLNLEKLQQTYLDFVDEKPTFFKDMAVELKNNLSNRLSDVIAWYTNLKTLISSLRSHDAMLKIKRASLYNLQTRPVIGALESLVNGRIFHGDVNKMKELLGGGKLGEKDVQRLKDILKYFSSIRTSLECHPVHGLVVKGRFVSFGDFIKNNELSRVCSTGKREKVVVLSSDTVVFDKDFKSDKVESLVVLAPKWDVTGDRVLNISGKSGEDFPVTREISGDSDGRPGRPGEPGGSFYGANKFGINVGTLLVLSFGGNGGRGERGQDGRNGADGKNIRAGDFPAAYNLDKSVLRNDGGKKIRIVFNYEWFKMDGGIGATGEDGGSGGKGGFGGLSGNIKLSCGDHSCRGVARTTGPGREGNDGEGGSGGLGGLNGHGRRCRFRTVLVAAYYTDCETVFNNGKRGLKGSDGRKGTSLFQRNEKEIAKPTALNYSTFIRMYREFIRTQPDVSKFARDFASELRP